MLVSTTNLLHYSLLAAIALLSCALLLFVVRLTVRLLQWRRLLHRDIVMLELTPPAHTPRTPKATQELFSVLHGLRSVRSWRDRFMRRDIVLAFEIVSTYDQGIRYLIRVDAALAPTVRQAVTAYLPQAKIREVEDNLPDAGEVTEFKEVGHYAFPLADIRSLEDHDPKAYIAGAMANLAAHDQLRFQLVVTPVKLREATELARRVLGNEDMLNHLNGRRKYRGVNISSAINRGIFSVLDSAGEVYHGTTAKPYESSYGSARANYEHMQVSTRQRPARTLSAFELEIMETMHRKLNQHLFRVSIRVGVSMADDTQARERLGALKSALQAYSVPPYQSLQAKVRIPFMQSMQQYLFQKRLPTFLHRHSVVLSSSELASLYHFPLGSTVQTDNLITSLSRTLPAPISLKQNKQLDVIFGINRHHGVNTPIGMTADERERHQYIVGGTGNGKTTLIQYQIVQDMQNGKGLAVIDPHGDMAEMILEYVPKERLKDVVYFNPDDLDYPFGLNVLELTPGLTGSALKREKELITESLISVFRKIFSDDEPGGHRIEYVLRCTIQTALTVPNATLFTIYELLNDPSFRKPIIKSLTDKHLVTFWKNEIGKAGDMQKVKMSAGITAKIGRFLFSESAKQILEQEKSTIDFDDIINTKKILICNFSKGKIGEDNTELLGTMVIAKLQLAGLRRVRIPPSERVPFYMYVDEFQNFASNTFMQLLSELRKYKMFIIMAEQSTSQQDDPNMLGIIFSNVGTTICFRTGNPNDERLLLPLFSPFIAENELKNLPTFTFYAKLGAIVSQEPLSGETILLPKPKNAKIAIDVIDNSRDKYALDISSLESTATATNMKKSVKTEPELKKAQTEKIDVALDV